MAGEFNIEFIEGIHAEIIVKTDTILPHTPLILDPVSKSYTLGGKIIYYRLSILSSTGLSNPVLLNNGKNSRFTAGGRGSCKIYLEIENDMGLSATDEITIYVG